MEQIIIEYDKNNKDAVKLIAAIKAMTFLKVKKKITGLDLAIIEMKSGKTIKCKDFNDYLKKVK